MSESMGPWSVQKNDLHGGWIITTYPRPLSEHDLRPIGRCDPARRGSIAAECRSETYARLIARLLNEAMTGCCGSLQHEQGRA